METEENNPRPTLQDLRDKQSFDPGVVAMLAEVNEVVVFRMLANHPIARWQAENILETLSLMRATANNQHAYTLDTVQVALLPEPGNE